MGIDVLIINLILAVPVFFICNFLFRRIKPTLPRRITTWLLTIALTPILYVGIAIMYIAIISYYPKKDFDKEKWRVDEEKRYEMTDDLVENNKLIGKNKIGDYRLIGTGKIDTESNRWTYYIGFKPHLLGIDPDVLELEFKDDEVIKCWTRKT